MELTEGIYAYVWSRPSNGCNTYVLRYSLEGKRRYMIIDPGERRVVNPAVGAVRAGLAGAYEESALDILLANLSKDGIAPEEIGLVVCTHCHPDHCEAALEIKRRTGALVAVHENDREAFLRIVGESYGGDGASPPEMEPDIFLGEGELQLGAPDPIALKILHTPGHSPGSISIYWPEKRALAAGDVVFYRNVGRTDFSGGDARTLRDSVAKLADLDVEHLLCGHPYGHPGVITGKGEVESNFRFVLAYVLPF
ncbi:MAG: MBL fold metallo-hydrolase [Chloroflexi bacterium]|nr:MBL fold metallo-hydrolase [Chloroflexota bacterium]